MIHRTFEIPLEPGSATEEAAAAIHGDLRLPEGPAPRAAVIVAHGFKGFKDWGFFPHLCERLAGEGFAVVSFNFSLNGVHPSAPTEFSDLDAFGRNTLTRELDDLHRVLDETARGDLLPRRPDRVGLLGHSRGGGSAILAAREREVHALVTWCAVATFDRWMHSTKREWRGKGRIFVANARTGQQMPLDVGLLEDFEANRERLDVEGAAAAVRAPWLIVHGAEDESVPVYEAERLARAASRTATGGPRPGARLRIVEGAGHTFEVGHPFEAPSPELEDAVEASVDHFREHLHEAGS